MGNRNRTWCGSLRLSRSSDIAEDVIVTVTCLSKRLSYSQVPLTSLLYQPLQLENMFLSPISQNLRSPQDE
ncbi:hypothetical protein J6590_002194 [Homalodisca vitripennis]|nr:hypothetical protein J6590_002194 [Homalodisca vitripennis]